MNKNYLIIVCISVLLLTTIIASILKNKNITENFVSVNDNNICDTVPKNFNLDKCLSDVDNSFKSKKKSTTSTIEYNRDSRICYRQEACKTDSVFINFSANTNDYTNFKGVPLQSILDPKYIWRGKNGKRYINDPRYPFIITIKDNKGKNIQVKKNVKIKDNLKVFEDKIKAVIKAFRPLYCDKIPGENISVADKIINGLNNPLRKEGERVSHPLGTSKQYPRCSTKKLKDIELPDDAIKIISSYIYEIEGA